MDNFRLVKWILDVNSFSCFIGIITVYDTIQGYHVLFLILMESCLRQRAREVLIILTFAGAFVQVTRLTIDSECI